MKISGLKPREYVAIGLIGLVLNLTLFFFIPVIQYYWSEAYQGKNRDDAGVVEVEISLNQTMPELEKREIKTITTLDRPLATPTLSPRQVQMNLNVGGGGGSEGGEGVGVSGTGGGVGDGTGVGVGQMMTYVPGETDTDAEKIGGPQFPGHPQRASREGVGGQVVVQWVVTEGGQATEVEVLQEEPKGYGFGIEAQKFVRALKFKPATLKGVSVRQRVRQKIMFVEN